MFDYGARLRRHLEELRKERCATWFLVPVQPSKERISGYSKKVKHPMDLDTITNKLSENKYASFRDILDDINLIFANTQVFNGPRHSVTKDAWKMREKLLAMLQSSGEAPPARKPKVCEHKD